MYEDTADCSVALETSTRYLTCQALFNESIKRGHEVAELGEVDFLVTTILKILLFELEGSRIERF